MMKVTTVCFFLLISAVFAAPPRQVKRSPDPKPYSNEEFYGWGEHRPHYGHYGHNVHHVPYGYHDHYHGHHDGYHGGHHGYNSGLNFGIGFHI